MKMLKFFEYVYLCIFIISTIEIIRSWNYPEGNRLWLFFFFAIVSLGMFFFRRTYRKKFEKRNRKNQQ